MNAISKYPCIASWTAVLLLAAGAFDANAATVEVGPPPKLMGCTLGVNFQSFGNCVVNKTTAQVNDAVSDAKKDLNKSIQQLQTQRDSLTQQLQSAQQQLQRPFMQAMSQIPTDQLISCLSSRGVNLTATLNSAAANPPQFVQTSLTSLWQKGMSMSATLLGQRLAAVRPGVAPASPSELIDAADQMFQQLAAQDPAAQCAWATIAPFRAQAKALAKSVYPTVKGQYDAMIQQTVRPAVNQAMVATLVPLMKQITSGAQVTAKAGGAMARATAGQVAGAMPEDAQKIALGVAHRYLLDPARMAQLTAEVNRLATALQTNPAGAAAVLPAIDRAAAPLSTWDEQIALDVAIETLRFYGHRVIDGEGRDLIGTAFSVALALKEVVTGLVTTAVGLAYDPPQAVSALIAGAIEVALDGAQSLAQSAMADQVHAEFDRALDAAHRALREKRPPSYYLQNAGPLGELLKHFPTENELLRIAIPQLQDMRNSLFGYHAAVRNLARSAAARQ